MQVNLTRIDQVVVGAASALYSALLRDYEQRLGRYVKLSVHDVKGEPLRRGDGHVLQAEETRVLRVLDQVAAPGAGAMVVVCDREGEQLTTEQLATRVVGAPHLVLVVGGAFGVSAAVRERADWMLAFGKVTLPHQLARLVATEQLYRCCRIARGEPYHH